MAQDLDEAGFQQLGFDAKKYEGWRTINEETQKSEFRSLYGTSAKILSLIWVLIQPNLDRSCLPLHLLVLYRWLKSYQTAPELKVEFGISVNTTNKWNEILMKEVAKLRTIKIDPNWHEYSTLHLGRTVDGIHYPHEEPRPFSTKMSSHKYGGKAAVDYEFCVATNIDKLVWLNGPFPSATHDNTILKSKGLKVAIEKMQDETNVDFRVIADNGYFAKDLVDMLAFRNEFDPADVAYFKDRTLSRHKNFNGHTKRFKVLKVPFRHSQGWNPSLKFPLHKACVETICVTIQMELDEKEIKSLLDPYPE